MKNNRIRNISVIGVAIVISVLALYFLLGRLLTPKNTTEYVFLYAENQPKDYPTTLGAYYFAEQVEKKTGGRIKIVVKPEGELGVEKDVINQLIYGGIDFARVSLSQMAESVPKLNVLQLPYIYKDSEHMWKVLDGEIGEGFMALTRVKGIESLSWYDAGARNFYSAGKPIRSIEDIRGLRVRVQESELMAFMVKALGAEPVKMEYKDVYSGFERGIIDVAENNLSSYYFMNHYEVAPFYTIDMHTRVPELQICSEHTWNLLSDEDKAIIKECAIMSALYERELWAKQETECLENIRAAGITVIELSDAEKAKFEAAMEAVYEGYDYDTSYALQRIREAR